MIDWRRSNPKALCERDGIEVDQFGNEWEWFCEEPCLPGSFYCEDHQDEEE